MTKPLYKRQGEAMQRDDGGFNAGMLRLHLIDVLADVPRHALSAQLALDIGGDDDAAYDYLAMVVAAVREAATSMNELRRATRKGAAK